MKPSKLGAALLSLWLLAAINSSAASKTNSTQSEIAPKVAERSNTNQPVAAVTNETDLPPGIKSAVGREWQLKDLCGTAAFNSKATLNVTADGNISGNGGINRFRGRITATGDAFKISPLTSTKIGGEREAMANEVKYLRALESATRFEVVGNTLRVTCRNEDKPLVFTKISKP